MVLTHNVDLETRAYLLLSTLIASTLRTRSAPFGSFFPRSRRSGRTIGIGRVAGSFVGGACARSDGRLLRTDWDDVLVELCFDLTISPFARGGSLQARRVHCECPSFIGS